MSLSMPSRHTCAPENAARFREWCAVRGGVAVWRVIDIARAGETVSTPVLTETGEPTPRPRWDIASAPERVYGIDEIDCDTGREIKRIRISVERGSGLSFALTSASSRRLRNAMDVAPNGAWYVFGFDNNDRRVAIIYTPSDRVPLASYVG